MPRFNGCRRATRVPKGRPGHGLAFSRPTAECLLSKRSKGFRQTSRPPIEQFERIRVQRVPITRERHHA